MWPDDQMQRRKTPCAHSDDGIRSESSHGPARAVLVDFSQAALYMPAAQVVGTLALIAASNVACSWLSHALGNVSAVRTAALASALALFCGWRPAQVATRSAGAEAMFDCLRPALLLYLAGIVVEQLAHSCASAPTSALPASSPWSGPASSRALLFHAAALCMLGAGLAQAYRPRAATDYPFVGVAAALGVVALVPPPPRLGEGPLCDAPVPWAAAERVCRAALFGGVYSALAYAAEPQRHSLSEVTLCAARAGVGSLWILCAHVYVLPVALLQAGFAGWARAAQSSYERQMFSELRGLAEPEEHDAEFGADLGFEFGNEYDYGSRARPESPSDSFRVRGGGVEGLGPLNGSLNGSLNGGLRGSLHGPLNGLGELDSDLLGDPFGLEDVRLFKSEASEPRPLGGGAAMPSKQVMQRVAEQLLQQGA